MIARLHGNLAVREDLVNVSIENNVVDAALGIHEAVPIRLNVEEGIMDHDGGVCVVAANVTPSIVVKRLDVVHVQRPIARFVEEFNRSYNIGVAGISVR